MSTLKVDAITDTGGNSIPYMKCTVLQTVVQQEDTATTFTQSGTNEVIMIASNAGDSTSHLSLSITPKSANSKILLTASVFHEIDNNANLYYYSDEEAKERNLNRGAGYYKRIDQDDPMTDEITTYYLEYIAPEFSRDLLGSLYVPRK